MTITLHFCSGSFRTEIQIKVLDKITENATVETAELNTVELNVDWICSKNLLKDVKGLRKVWPRFLPYMWVYRARDFASNNKSIWINCD